MPTRTSAPFLRRSVRAGNARPSRGPGHGLLLSTLTLSACGPGPLAEAAGSRWTVDEAARIIVDHSTVPGDTQVVRAVAELWVDYTLLATVLDEDTTLAPLDVEPLAGPVLDQIMLARLREEAVPVDTVVGDEELAARFAADMPGARATASQILLLLPRGATSRQRDSVRAVADGLHARIEAGADFAALAGRHSDDPGSGARGGSLGTFGRGEMLAEVDEAVFRLRPGELGDPVETELGYHILRLDALEVPTLSEVGEDFRRRIREERIAEAEAAYVGRLETASGLAVAEEGLKIVRALASAPPSRLSRGASRRPLLTWSGGEYTVADFARLFEMAPAGFADGIVASSDEELESALRRLGQEALLLAEARSRGLAPMRAEADSVAEEVRNAIRSLARDIGLVPVTGRTEDGGGRARDTTAEDSADTGSEPEPAPVAGLVEAALIRIVSGEREIVPLGGVTFLLRNRNAWRIHERRIGATVARIAEILSP